VSDEGEAEGGSPPTESGEHVAHLAAVGDAGKHVADRILLHFHLRCERRELVHDPPSRGGIGGGSGRAGRQRELPDQSHRPLEVAALLGAQSRFRRGPGAEDHGGTRQEQAERGTCV
jgi:hypothetical protein